ncbi:hypothetical protein LBMAG52_33420 [Planctomycetia bacterium]|nr:hypothetical protein LBMAG52_33420 [Planctomycetia bacterium]
MTLGPRMAAMLLTMVASVALAVGCGHSEGKASNPGSEPTITLGTAVEEPESPASKAAPSEVVPISASDAASAESVSEKPSDEKPAAAAAPVNVATADETRTFKVEGPESAIRVSFDDVDLLKVMNLDPVPADAPERLPKWLKALDGKRIRVRGFMYPPFQDTDIRGFVLARDNQICCFGRTPKEYDLVDIFLRKGATTHYIQNRPFDVVGVFHIKSEIEKYTAMYELEDAVVIEK